MPELNGVGVLLPSAHESAALPGTGFEPCPGMHGQVAVHLAEIQRSGVVSRQWTAVQGYLERYPDLAAVLPTICEHARHEFDPSDELAMEVYSDPEIKDEYLTLYIRQSRYDADIMARIERLSDAFSEQTDRASGYLLLTSDFSPPRGSNGL